MVRVFAITSAILLFAVALSGAQNVDVVSQVAQSRLIVNGPLSQVIDSVVTLGEFAFITSGTPLAVFAVNVTQMRTRTPTATVRNVTIAQDSSPSGVAVGDSVFFFGFQNIYRLNVSQAIADPLYRFNATRDVSSLKYERQAGQNPIPTRAFTASVGGTTFAYFIGSVLNENTNLREIIRVEPAKFDQGISNATAVISINVAAQSFVDAVYGDSHAALLFSGDEGSNQTIVALFNPTTAVVGASPSPIARTVTIGDLEVAGRPMAFDESRNVIYIAGQRPSDGGQPYLYKINLNLTTNSATVYNANDGTGAVTATKLGELVEEVKAVNIDPVSGVVFVALYDGLAAGSVVRVNPVTMTLNEPAVFFSQGRQIPAFTLVDPATRFLFVGLELDFVSFRYPTVCPSQCFEYFGQDNLNFPRQGQCIASSCECAPGFHGEACDQRDCSSDCGGPSQGTCNNGRCICESRWTGANCTVPQCPNNCTGNGICETASNGTLTCRCTNAQFRGEDCSLLSYQICPSFSALDQCVGAPGCGWCVDTSSCSIGNQVGPANGTCQEWLVGNSREIGTFVVAIIFIIIFGVMVVLNVASAVSVDHQTTNYLEEENLVTIPFLKQIYWRDERSAKAWKLFDQLQFISYFSLIGVAFPTRLIGFTRYFNWAMLLLPLPFAPRTDPFFPERDIGRASASPSASGSPVGTVAGAGVFGATRSLLNFEQLSSTLGFGDLSRPFYAVMFWFIILLAILLVLYTIFAIISWLAFNGKAEDPKKFRKTYAVVLRQKVFYILTRVVLIGYMPINITAAYHLKSSTDGSGGVRAASAICIIVFGILPIVFNAFVVWGKTKELLFLYLKLRFGALYSVYHYEKARFNLVVLARKFLIAILIGFLATNKDNDPLVYAQVFVIIAIIIVYLIVLFVVRPYLDQVHLLLDAGINILNGIAWGIALLCIDTAQPAGTFNRGAASSPVAEIIAAICVLLSFAICCVAYCHSWYNMEGDTSLLVLCRGSKNKPGESIHDGDDDDESGDEENAVPMKPAKQPEPESESSSDDLASDSEDEKPKSARAAVPPPPPPAEDESSSEEQEEEEDQSEASSSKEASAESSSEQASSSEASSSESDS